MTAKSLSRRDFLLMTAGCAAGTLLAACQPQVVEKTVVVKETVEVEVVETVETIKEIMTTVEVAAQGLSGTVQHFIYGWSPVVEEAYMARGQAFREVEPGVTVDTVTMPWGELWTKASLAYAAGTPPDLIIWDYPSYPLHLNGELLDLGPNMVADPNLLDPAKYNQNLWTDYELAPGKFYALPDFIDGFFIYLNMDMFDAAGIEYPPDEWTYDDFLTIAQELTIVEGGETKQYGCTWGEWWSDWAFQSVIWGFGGEWAVPRVEPTELHVDAPETIKAWQWMQDLVYKHQVAPGPGAGETEIGGPFESRLAAMVPYGDWWLPGVRDTGMNWDLHTLPKGPGGQKAPRWGQGTSMSSGSKNPEATWAYLRFMVGELGQRIMAATSPGVPVPLSVAQSQLFTSPAWAPEHYYVRGQVIEDSRVSDVLHKNWNAMLHEALYPLARDPVVNGEMTAEEALTENADAIRQALFGS